MPGCPSRRCPSARAGRAAGRRARSPRPHRWPHLDGRRTRRARRPRASWIHGVDGNPLWALAPAFGIDTVEFTVGSFQFDGRPIGWHALRSPADRGRGRVVRRRPARPRRRAARGVEHAPPPSTYASAVNAVLRNLRIDGDRAARVREYTAHRSEDLCGAPVTVLDAHGLDEEHVPATRSSSPAATASTPVPSPTVSTSDCRRRSAPCGSPRIVPPSSSPTGPSSPPRTSSSPFRSASCRPGRSRSSRHSPDVLDAMGRLGMGVYDKVFLRFPERFWGDDWVVRQQGPAGVDWHSWYDMSRVTGEPVLAALVGGAGARRIESLPIRSSSTKPSPRCDGCSVRPSRSPTPCASPGGRRTRSRGGRTPTCTSGRPRTTTTCSVPVRPGAARRGGHVGRRPRDRPRGAAVRAAGGGAVARARGRTAVPRRTAPYLSGFVVV